MTLPIHNILPQLKESLACHPAVILQAPPGSGKTTRVPLALLSEKWLQQRKIIMLEPRRLAVTNAARYMAELSGEAVGKTVGYTIRYQRQSSQHTRIEVVTEGILTRRLQSDPELQGIGLIIFDEFHERNLNNDLALALCRDAQLGLREDLKILIMSATLDGEPLAKLLNAPLLSCEGQSYPVTIHYSPAETSNLVTGTTAAVKQAVRETTGNILAFLPGAGEIKRCREGLKDLSDIDVRPLYGTLPYSEQELAILPSERRKVVLATNIAETSLTIEGISVVIDSGYAREPRFDPSSGLTRLDTVRISQASATQRSGRAGRLEPGTCYRLWTSGSHGSLLPFTPPEIHNTDLAPLALELANWGCNEPLQLNWLDPPPEGALKAGRQQLQQLGALNDSLQLTTHGKQLAKLPCHPRLGSLLLAAEQLNTLPLGCDLVALLAEPLRKNHIDLLSHLENLVRHRSQKQFDEYRNIERASSYWRKRFRLRLAAQKSALDPTMLSKLLIAAFPDRIGRLRQGEKNRYRFASGQGGQLADHLHLDNEKFLVATEFSGKRGQEGKIIQAIPLELTDILEQFPSCPWEKEVLWDDQNGRIIAQKVQRLEKLNLREKPTVATEKERTDVFRGVLSREGLEQLNWSPAIETFRARVAVIREHFPSENWPDLSHPSLLKSIDRWLIPFIGQAKNRADLKKIDLFPALYTLMDWQQRQRLDQLAPERFHVPSGSHLRIHYVIGASPVLSVKLQEMFGTTSTPCIAAGRIPLQLHLLSPAGRPLQVTQDLATFWSDVYPEIKKEMKGRYPKHPWPDDPHTAVPTRHAKRRTPTS